MTGTEAQRLPRWFQARSLQAGRGHRAEREGRALPAAAAAQLWGHGEGWLGTW